MRSDIEIAQSTTLLPIARVAEKLGLGEENLEHYGRYMAKLRLPPEKLENRGKLNDFDDREVAERQLYETSSGEAPETPGNFKTLKNLRNALAHGVLDKSYKGRASRFLQQLTSNEAKLQEWLTRTLR